MDYLSISDAAESWGITHRRIQRLCSEGRIPGAKKITNSWVIPHNAQKPLDGRTTLSKKTLSSSKQHFTSIDLFAGPGGLCTGFKWAGIKPLIAVEWSYWTVQTYAASHNAEIFDLGKYLDGTMENLDHFFRTSDQTLLIYGDINKVSNDLIKKILLKRFNVKSVDIVTGGAPCESFSMAGDRKEDDDRNELYQNILRIARGVDCKIFLFENVKGLLSKKLDGKHGEMFHAICKEFQSQQKDSATFSLASTDKNEVLLKAVEYGVPQSRERIFLVGLNQNYPQLKFKYPKKTHGEGRRYRYVTVKDALMDLPQMDMGIENNNYSYSINSVDDETHSMYIRRMRGDLSMPPAHLNFTENSLSNHKAPGHTSKMLARISSIRPGEGMKSAFERLCADGQNEFVEINFPKTIYAARNRRLLLDEPSFTATSHCLDEMIHPESNRGLSPREVARLQSFPDWYQFQGPHVKFHSDPEQDQYEQIGDAIPPLLAYALGNSISQTLENCQEQV